MTSLNYLRRLSGVELQRMRALLLEELASSVRSGAEAEHQRSIVELLDAVDARIAADTADVAPSVMRRLEIAAARA